MSFSGINRSGSTGLGSSSGGGAARNSGSRAGGFAPVEEGPPKTFHEAAERGDTNLVLKWIERTMDFDINHTDKLARTAVHWAAESGHQETTQTLIDFGANVKAVECNGRTAFHLAARCGDADMLRLLLEGVPQEERVEFVNQGDHNDITPVFLALQRGTEGQEAVEFLLASGARYNQQGAVEAPKVHGMPPPSQAAA